MQQLRELVVDNFAGGGGASTGIEMAIGRSVDVAINHDPAAIAMHEANHPDTVHYCESVWDVDPRDVAAGQQVGLVWLSPDCTHHSKARGGKPRQKGIRGLAWVGVRWAATVKPRVIMLENVEEFMEWGPLDADGRPIKAKKGRTFRSFVNALRRHGYRVEWRVLKACDYGAPTTRKRLFMIARCDGKPIVWPEESHAEAGSLAVKSGRKMPYRVAAEIIDWSIPCPSIFERKKPLAENTMRRIARGLKKFVLDNPDPFIIKVNHSSDDVFRGQTLSEPLQTITSKNGWGIVTPYLTRIGQTGFGGDRMSYSLDEPITTITTKAEHMLISPTLIQTGYGEREGQQPRALDLQKPIGTLVAGGQKHALVAALLAQYHSETASHDARGQTLDSPIMTLDTSNRYALVTSNLIKFRGDNIGSSVEEPIPTITAGGNHIGEVRAFLMAYYGASVGQPLSTPLGTVTTHDRFGLVMIHGTPYQIVDIGMRMLTPRELYNGQGFPMSYIINPTFNGKPFSQAEQVAKCGNSVSPVIPEALVRANLPELCVAKNRDRFSEADLEVMLA
ncbi:DNA (cytosine-5)-methyltransferase 1 [Paenibacillus cellulosilyticus]|uniref:DNA (cytosine-5-)-methyltransferase n=1 Tax=Paenibacillus cellulosilyticus TaxID=375489 RepID=A0A2V2YGK6_9BACL|nr:DNA cytosine methyltransferase [Paenibacillus cellulosilyticus]PWV90238.1 DNA (cytosine-5)-methyltransferase 1 [Paenibacillus cellulosilyticus]QKS43396.1 DNA cytosine methyltransferase [Paenibacillus cellulosilyticus]